MICRLPLSLVLACICLFAQSGSGSEMSWRVFERWMQELSNWGRWGADDQLGAINLITPAKRLQAAMLVKEGISFSLARDAETIAAIDNPEPFVHKMLNTGTAGSGKYSSDSFQVSYHGYAHTHLDALCHFFFKGKMFNGFPKEVVVASGAHKLSVIQFKNGIFTRAILIDTPRLKGLDYLEPGVRIYPSDLEAWEKKAGVKVSSGDLLLIRTGRWARRSAKGAWDVDRNAAGLDVSCARWIKARDVAMVGSDAATDVSPSGVEFVPGPMHLLLLVAMGTPILDNCDLELVSREAARRGRWEFLLTAAPLSVPGATGSPLNPIATF